MSRMVWLVLFLSLSSLPAMAGTTCVRNGAGEIDTADAGFNGCATTPQGYDVTIYKMGLCTANPSPHLSVTPDFSSCHMLLDGAGQYTHLGVGATITLPGATMPPQGTYGYAVLVIKNELGIANTQTFSTNMTGTGGAAGTGKTCWTVTGTVDRQSPAPALVDCGAAAAAAPGITIDKLNDLNGGNGDPSTGGTFDAEGCSPTFWCAVTGGNVSAKLATTTLTTAVAGDHPSGGTNTITRLIAVEAFSAPITITSTTTNIDIGFNVTNASGLWNAGALMRQFGTGPFSVVISAK